jgi:Heparinase II/III N-terminus/Heparinase II/III-like protein
MSYLKSVSKKLASKAVSRIGKYVRPYLPVDSIDVEMFDLILRSNQAGDIDSFVQQAASRSQIIADTHTQLIRRRISKEFPEHSEEIRQRADACLQSHFSELGSGYTDVSDGFGGVRWLEDFKSGVSWPKSHYLRVPIIYSDSKSDIKTVWELSRFQFAVSLGQMELLTGDPAYRRAFVNLIDDWQRKNPYPLGPNWICAMELAIRATNIITALELFQQTKPLEPAFLKALYTSLYQHGRHIRANLEDSGRGLSSNHYLADLIGLLTLGAFFDKLPDGREWLEFAVAELEIEIQEQTTDDGFCYESSANYHLLTLEFYLYTLTFCRKNDIALSVAFVRALQKGLDITAELRDTTAKLPNIGDNDSGRLLKFAERQDRDPEWLLFWGLMEGLEPVGFSPTSCATAESLWLFGGRRLQREIKSAKNEYLFESSYLAGSSRYFKSAGIVKMAHDDLSLTVNVADIGVSGIGGHKHNDQLALTMSWGNSQVIIDPGTLTYTTNETERNRLRSIQAHSTVQIDGKETNRFLPGRLFSLRRCGSPGVISWLSTRELDLLQAEHNCYQRLTGAPIIGRAVYFDKLARFWLIRDTVSFTKGQSIGKHAAKWRLSSALITGPLSEIQSPAQVGCSIDCRSNDAVQRELVIRRFSPGSSLAVEPFTYAPEYGVPASGFKTLLFASPGVTELIWGIFPNLAGESKERSEELLRAKFDLLEWRNVRFDLGGNLATSSSMIRQSAKKQTYEKQSSRVNSEAPCQ